MRFCCLLLLSGLAWAQAPASPQERCGVEGSVLNASTGEPVPRARVSLRLIPAPAPVRTGTGGAPALPNSPAASMSGRMASSSVTLLPASSRRTDLFKAARAGDDGKFRLSGVAPGAYRLYAWEEVEQNAVRYDPDFVKPFENSGKAVTVAEGGRENVTLKQIPKQTGQ